MKNFYFHALEINLILERSQLIANREDMLEMHKILDDFTIVQLSPRDRSSTKWKFLFAINVTVLQQCLKSFFFGCRDVLLNPRPCKRFDVNCVTYKANEERFNDNLCLLRALCMHKTGTQMLEEETSKLFINLNVTAENIQGVALEDLHIVERLVDVNNLVYDKKALDKRINGKLAESSLQKISSMSSLLRHNIHLCYVTDVNKVFK